MSAIYYRLLFEPNPETAKCTNSDAFADLLRSEFPRLKLEPAGYIIADAMKARHGHAGTMWQAIYRPSEEDGPNHIYSALSSKHWQMGGHSVHLFIKPGPGENEIRFPIWD